MSTNRKNTAADETTPESTPPLDPKPTAAPATTSVQDEAPAAPAEKSDPNKVKIKLAHPLDKPEDLRFLGLPPEQTVDGKTVKGYRVNDTITVNRAAAQSLINAGYAQVDPEDKAAVAAVLNQDA